MKTMEGAISLGSLLAFLKGEAVCVQTTQGVYEGELIGYQWFKDTDGILVLRSQMTKSGEAVIDVLFWRQIVSLRYYPDDEQDETEETRAKWQR